MSLAWVTENLEARTAPATAVVAEPPAVQPAETESMSRTAVGMTDTPRAPLGDDEREALYASFQPLVRRLIWQYGEDAESRSDLEGEIYYRFCQLLSAYDPERGVPLRAYLARNLPASVYTYARKQWLHRRRENSTEIEQLVGTRADAVDPTSQWDDRMVMQDLIERLPQAIAQLSLCQRRVVIWRYYEQRSYEEIASMLNIKEGTARAVLRNGLKNLRRRLGVASAPSV